MSIDPAPSDTPDPGDVEPRPTLSRREIALWLALAISVLTNVTLVGISMIKKIEPTPTPETRAAALPSDHAALTPDEAAMASQMRAAFGSVPASPRADAQKAVPLARVLANPRDFEGKKVELRGYFGYRMSAHGRTFLYPSTSDAAFQMTTNAIRLELPDSVDATHFDGACIVEGFFHAEPDWAPVAGRLVVMQLMLEKPVPGVDGGRGYTDLYEGYRSADYMDYRMH